MRYFIDGGACDGRSVKAFRAWKEGSDGYEVICFEPNPQFHSMLSNMPDVELRKEAIWVENCTARLFLGRRGPEASSLYRSKSNVDQDNFVDVSCIDFSTWLKESFSERDEIVLKQILLRDERFLALDLRDGTPAAPLIGCALRDVDFPEECLVTLIRRGAEIIIPSGRTLLQEDDHLTIIGEPQGLQELTELYGSPPEVEITGDIVEVLSQDDEI